MSSYCWAILVIFALQKNGMLPIIQEVRNPTVDITYGEYIIRYNDDLKTLSSDQTIKKLKKQSLSVLLTLFFVFMSNFNFKRDTVSISEKNPPRKPAYIPNWCLHIRVSKSYNFEKKKTNSIILLSKNSRQFRIHSNPITIWAVRFAPCVRVIFYSPRCRMR